MAEVQTTTESGEMTQRFIEFVMMQAQNAALFLGQIPNPRGEGPEINLPVAKMFIDQLAMIRAKTNGNLSNDELAVLNNAISNLQMTFYEVSQEQAGSGAKGTPAPAGTEGVEDQADASTRAASPETGAAEGAAGEPLETGDETPKKKFSKSYGAS